MPAFGDLLTDKEINDVIAYMRDSATMSTTIRWAS